MEYLFIIIVFVLGSVLVLLRIVKIIFEILCIATAIVCAAGIFAKYILKNKELAEGSFLLFILGIVLIILTGIIVLISRALFPGW